MKMMAATENKFQLLFQYFLFILEQTDWEKSRHWTPFESKYKQTLGSNWTKLPNTIYFIVGIKHEIHRMI